MDRSRASARHDRGLFRRLAGGDAAALEALFDLHAERLYGHALWLTRRRQDAEDAVQTVFVKLAGMGSDLLGVRRPVAYLHRMVRSATLDDRRRAARRDEVPVDHARLVADASDAGRLAEARLLEPRIDALPVEQREVLALHVWEGFAFSEIGRMTGVSRFTAASRYRLALESLRRQLDEG